eukprot:6177727-Pleurochrysis_carterae.AAC.1
MCKAGTSIEQQSSMTFSVSCGSVNLLSTPSEVSTYCAQNLDKRLFCLHPIRGLKAAATRALRGCCASYGRSCWCLNCQNW